MTNVFDSVRVYLGNWEVTNSRKFNEQELNAVRDAVVVNSDYGKSVRFNMVGGGMTFIPLSRDSQLSVGEAVDLTKASILTLEREGDDPITRIDI